MRFRRPRVVDRFVPNASANELGQYVLTGAQFTAVPPADHGACDDTARVILRELGRHFRPLWVTQLWKSPNGGIVKRNLHVLGSYIPITKNRDPRTSGLLIKNLLLPTIGSLGISWQAPIYMDDILDGLTWQDKQKAGILPCYEPLDWKVVAALRRNAWEKHEAPRLSPEQEAIQDRNVAAAEEEAAQRAQVERLSYIGKNDKLNRVEVEGVGIVPPPNPTVFLGGANASA